MSIQKVSTQYMEVAYYYYHPAFKIYKEKLYFPYVDIIFIRHKKTKEKLEPFVKLGKHPCISFIYEIGIIIVLNLKELLLKH